MSSQSTTPEHKQRGFFSSNWLTGLLIFCLALLVQETISPLLNALGMHFPNTFYQPGQHFFLDLKEYQEMAHSLLAGQGFRYEGQLTTMRPPAYPVFLAAIYTWGSHESVIVIQRLLGALCALLAWLLAWQISASKRTAVLAGLMTSIYIPYQMMAFSLLSDMLFALLLLLVPLVLIQAFQTPQRTFLFVGLGSLLACTTLTRPVTLFLAPCLYFLRWNSPLFKRQLSITLLTFGLCLAPWIWRNYQVTGRLIPVASAGAYNLWQGTFHASVVYGESAGNYDPEFKQEQARLMGPHYYIDYQAEPGFMRAAIARIQADPLAYIQNSIERLLRVYTAFPGTRDWVIEKRWKPYFLLSAVQVSIWLLAFWGLLQLRNPEHRGLFVLLLGYSLLFHALLNLISRYVLPWLPLVFVLAALALTHLWNRCFPSHADLEMESR